jgi:tRNA (uracil-5-)-methyltransferase TRM9
VPAPLEVFVRPEVVERLLSINREFYQSFADPFRATRGRLQPGVIRALESVNLDANVLDVGCAHGVLAEQLAGSGFSGSYVGLDSSQPLLDSVPDHLHPPQYKFALADLGDEEWPETARALHAKGSAPEQSFSESSISFDRVSEIPASEQSVAKSSALFDWVFAFAVVHHIPSSDLRGTTAAAIRALLATDGHVAVSVWDFLASARLRERVVAWDTAGISEEEVDEGDHLVDWREGGSGVRYVHHFAQNELHELAEESGFQVSQEYRSDGENGRLGLYQIWEIA